LIFAKICCRYDVSLFLNPLKGKKSLPEITTPALSLRGKAIFSGFSGIDFAQRHTIP